MKRNLLLGLLLVAGLVGCNSGSSGTTTASTTANSVVIGNYTAAEIGLTFSVIDGSCSGNSCILSPGQSVSIGYSLSSLNPLGYFILSNSSLGGLQVTNPSGTCGSTALANPSCTFKFTCNTATATVQSFYIQLTGEGGTANMTSSPYQIQC